MALIAWLSEDKPEFPETDASLSDPSGLLAAGGNLDQDTLCAAYFRGIFPWFTPDDPILWWAPETRAILTADSLRINRSNRKLIQRSKLRFSSNQQFEEVIHACADRPVDERWIDSRMISSYIELHRSGIAHSIEAWRDDSLVGGLYGLTIGSIFCGESMFNREPNAAKLSFLTLAQTLFSQGFTMIDCQIQNPFLESMGVTEVKREQFEALLYKSRCKRLSWPNIWQPQQTDV